MNRFFIKFLTTYTIAVFLFFSASAGISVASELKFAQISDIHYSLTRPDTEYKLLSKSKPLLEDAIQQINAESNIDFTVLTGDIIDKPNEDDFLSVIYDLNQLKSPRLFVVGNHDTSPSGFVTKDIFINTLKNKNKGLNFDSTCYLYKPKKGFKVIVLDGALNDKRTSSGFIPKEEIDWLDTALKNSQKDTVLIFIHFPIIPPYDAKNHEITNAEEVKKVIEKYNMPIAVFSGHYHMTKIVKRGNIIHIATPALITYPNAFRIVTVTNKKDKVIFNIELKETNLKNIQKAAKITALGGSVHYGRESDRNTVITVNRFKGNKK